VTLEQHEQSNDPTNLGGQEMSELGIIRVPVDYFHYKEFRYTHLTDAIAEAKRDENRRPGVQRGNPI
jgi:hypothetical protein